MWRSPNDIYIYIYIYIYRSKNHKDIACRGIHLSHNNRKYTMFLVKYVTVKTHVFTPIRILGPSKTILGLKIVIFATHSAMCVLSNDGWSRKCQYQMFRNQ